MSLQYQDFLLEEFKARRSRNPHYSLRAFARDIGMPASKLSQNLRGLCGISVAKAESIAEKLQMSGDEKQLFVALVESQHARSRVARQQAQVSLQRIKDERIDDLSLEAFATVRDWYHMAILELTVTKDFEPSEAWVAKKLNLSPEIIKDAVDRLVNVGMLERKENTWKASESFELRGGIPSRVVREHHKQVLQQAIEKIETVDVNRREYTSEFFAFDASLLPEVRRAIRELQGRVVKMSRESSKDSVYVMSIQVFPVAEGDSK